VLACACDHRIIRADTPIGASEVRVGVPFHAAALEILRHAFSTNSEAIILSGQQYRGTEVVRQDLAHEPVEDEPLVRAIAAATDLAAIPPGAYRLTERQPRQPAIDRIRSADDDEVRKLWASPQAANAIRNYLARIRARPR
jgi:enoyl-CoA hydratase/carnithine racemase